MSAKAYAVVGAGMQGTAAAYDLGRFGEARQILLMDADKDRATASADRVNRLLKSGLCRGERADVRDTAWAADRLKGFNVVLSCVPYKLHEDVHRAAYAASASSIDLGNDTDVTLDLLKQDDDYKDRGLSLVPDTGLAPGLVNSIGTTFIEELDAVDSIKLYCGGLPETARPPFNYNLQFSVEGLVGEYVDEAIAIRDHEVVRLATLQELEEVDVPGVGSLEAFTTSSGTSTAPFTFREQVRNYEYKTLRYPGHCLAMRTIRDSGFWSEEPIGVGGVSVVPISFFYGVATRAFWDPSALGVVVVHAIGEGLSDRKPARVEATIIEGHDALTGFSAMERLTGYNASIIAIEIAQGRVRPGCIPYELAIPGCRVLDEFARRGIVAVRRAE